MGDVSTKIVELLSGVYLIPGATNVGVITEVLPEITNVYLVDSGCTEFDGEYILEVLSDFFSETQTKYQIKAIINTHSHADHTGANKTIQNKTNCQIWMPSKETAATVNPLINATMMWGAYPPKELRTVFFNAGEMSCDVHMDHGFNFLLSDNSVILALELPGHSFETMGIIYENKDHKQVLFTGDSLFPKNQLSHHWIPFMINPDKFLESLDLLIYYKDLQWIIPSHGDFIKRNLKETIELNQLVVMSNKKMIISILQSGPKTTEQIVQEVAKMEEINLTIAQYSLISSTIKSYLSVMHDAGDVNLKIDDNVLFWSLSE